MHMSRAAARECTGAIYPPGDSSLESAASPPRVYPLLLLLVGLALFAGGARLLMLGGSVYYLLSGMAIAVSAVLLWRGRAEGAWAYGAMYLATLIWSLWEVGFTFWGLLPRLALLTLLGAWLLTPWTRRALISRGDRLVWARRPLVWLCAFPIAIVAGAAAHALLANSAPDPLYQTGFAELPSAGKGATNGAGSGDWLNYGNDRAGTRFSPVAQLTPQNVRELQVAWIYRTRSKSGSLQVTPLKVDSTLYLCDGANDVIALNAETGEERWRFFANIDTAYSRQGACRGVAYYQVSDAADMCAERIITTTRDARLLALDAHSGELCPGFGANGQISLLTGMGEVWNGYYQVSSAPTIVSGKVVLGGSVKDNQYWGEPSGVVRAYDAVSGRFAWAFDVGRPGQHGEPPAGEFYTRSTPNAWAPMSADEELGLVYVPTGNATPDYYGAQRRTFDEQYSSAVVALEAQTGKIRWSFQSVHHDLWDYDLAAQPTLVDIRKGDITERALIQATKRGEVFLLDRRTGQPLAEVRELRVSQEGAAPGERVFPTQPFSVAMPSFRGPDLRERDMWGMTPFDQLWCRIRFTDARYAGPMTPPGPTPSIQYPGDLGSVNWGGVSIDPDRGLMIVNSSRVANYGRLLPRAEADARGLSPVSSEHLGHGFGPPFAQAQTPYAAEFRPFLSPLNVPCQAPPYGMLTVVDLATRAVVWTQKLGTARDSGPLATPSRLPILLGTPNHGGSVVTRGGLIFIGATQDRYLRAFETATGDLLWESRLPAGGQATPMTYLSSQSGRQFVVIAAGGAGPLLSKRGDYIIAYALPR